MRDQPFVRVNDLMAIATVRRLLLELGHQLLPEGSGGLVGPLTLWVAEPRPELDSCSPLQVLGLPEGEARVRQVLLAMLSAHGDKPAVSGEGREAASGPQVG